MTKLDNTGLLDGMQGAWTEGDYMANKIFCVVSHTHWDREWYMPFEKFRVRLVDLMDHLLEILEIFPQFIFNFDAQTVVLEDYLELRPEKIDILKKHIGEGRILVGPWYVQNDFYLTSGEATVRNLLIGSKLAENMGKCTWVGYTPDQFGLISQLPQILKGFRMDNCVFARGYRFFENMNEEVRSLPRPSELIWEGADGSKVLGIFMPFWYNNAQRFSENTDKSIKLLDMIERCFEGVALTPYLLLMNGVDHLEAQENLIPILEELSRRLPEEKKIQQCSMKEYVENVKEYVCENNLSAVLPLYKGEMRNGLDHMILQGTLSSRIYLKTQNVSVQNLLECNFEPLYSFIYGMGAEKEYPGHFAKYMWKLLIHNHPHDSICGCSRDEVHNHMEDRFQRIKEVGEELIHRGMDFITAHVSREGLSQDDYIISVFNTVESMRSGVLQVDVQFSVEEKVKGFNLLDEEGKEVPYLLLKKEKKFRDIFSPINLPGVKEVDSYQIQFYVDNISGLSFRTFAVKPQGTFEQAVCGLCVEDTKKEMENEYVKIQIGSDGKIDLLYKQTGRVYSNVLTLEDTADSGDSYLYMECSTSQRVVSAGEVPQVRCVTNTKYETGYAIKYELQLPEYYDRRNGKRSENLVLNRVEMILTLKKGQPWLDIGFNIDNRSKDHRLRALIHTGFSSDFSAASTPFDIILRDRKDILKGVKKDGTQPNSGFVNIDGEKEGIAVLNHGAYEYEHILGEEGTLAITLLRANGLIEMNSMGEAWQAPGNQCQRHIQVGMALYPHIGNYLDSCGVLRVKEYQNPLSSWYQPVDLTKFVGGRPAVQDSEIKEIFYRKDPYNELVLPRQSTLLNIIGENLVLSAIKKAENEDMLIVRVYNTSDCESSLGITYHKPLTQAFRMSLREEKLERLSFEKQHIQSIPVGPKEIITIGIV